MVRWPRSVGSKKEAVSTPHHSRPVQKPFLQRCNLSWYRCLQKSRRDSSSQIQNRRGLREDWAVAPESADPACYTSYCQPGLRPELQCDPCCKQVEKGYDRYHSKRIQNPSVALQPPC